jgi:hypothetical protein
MSGASADRPDLFVFVQETLDTHDGIQFEQSY